MMATCAVGNSTVSPRFPNKFDGLMRNTRYKSSFTQRRNVPICAISLPFVGNASNKRNQLKQELLEAITPLQRGLAASEEDKAYIEKLASQLEKTNPNRKSLASPLVNGQWELLYTTSESILGTKKPSFLRPKGPIYQFIDTSTLTARNQETWPLFNQVTAELQPKSSTAVDVQFKQFKLLGLIPVTAPPSARGALDITYLDEQLRVSRGDKGNLVILKMKDPEGKP